ncbi:MAG TPA: hypothetical protein VLG67_02910 [Candidatus Saccharimonadales bacterium]|nr:hypothetical protein [Candidatus Saccharimonadales bacterium]
MPKNIFGSEETSFENGISLTKPVKAMSDAAKQQAKAAANDFVAQLYGVKDKTTDLNDPNAKNQKQQQQQAPPPKPKKSTHILSGMSNAGDHAKFIARQQYLDKGDAKGAEDIMFHMQHYFDESVMTLEDRVKKFRREQEQQRAERKKQQEEEDQQKKEKEAKEKEELPQATGKGRNRMGKKPKTSISLKMSQTKTEINRGATG